MIRSILLLSLLMAPAQILAADDSASSQPSADELKAVLDLKPLSGEPHQLNGKRLYFTDWNYIRPGVFAWVDAQGNRVSARRDVNIDAWGSQIVRHSAPWNIEIVTQPAQRGPRLEREKPWEAKSVLIRTILHEGDKYRAWGSAQPGGDVYMESTDGLKWTRPELGQREFEGSHANNLLAKGPAGCIFIDPSSPPAERYKCIGGPNISWEQFEAFRKQRPDAWEPRALRTDTKPMHIRSLGGAVSEDGLSWRAVPELFTVEHSDGVETGYYDTLLKKYVIYTRNWMVGTQSPKWKGDWPLPWIGERGWGRRVVGRAESDRFGGFPLSDPVIIPGAGTHRPSEVFYTSIHTTLPGAPMQHLMFPAVWDTRNDDCAIEVWSSFNGKVWERVPGPRVLETAAFGEWDGGCLFAYPDLIELPNGDFAMTYQAYNFPHKYPRAADHWQYYTGFMIWPKGRIIGVKAKEVGEFATIGLLAPGRKIKLNAISARAGGIRVELTTPLDNKPYPGRTFADCDVLQGDQHWKPVTWKGQADLGLKENDPVVIRFHMEDATLFGMEFE